MVRKFSNLKYDYFYYYYIDNCKYQNKIIFRYVFFDKIKENFVIISIRVHRQWCKFSQRFLQRLFLDNHWTRSSLRCVQRKQKMKKPTNKYSIWNLSLHQDLGEKQNLFLIQSWYAKRPRVFLLHIKVIKKTSEDFLW